MKNKTLMFMIGIIVISLLGSSMGAVQALPLSFGPITVEPDEVTAKATITITVTVSGDTPTEVRVIVEECNGNAGVCYPDIQNVSMNEISTGTYQAEATLKHTDATYITLISSAEINGVWSKSNKKIVNLSEGSNGTPDGNGDDGDKTPGFELIFVMIAIATIVLLMRRKRF